MDGYPGTAMYKNRTVLGMVVPALKHSVNVSILKSSEESNLQIKRKCGLLGIRRTSNWAFIVNEGEILSFSAQQAVML